MRKYLLLLNSLFCLMAFGQYPTETPGGFAELPIVGSAENVQNPLTGNYTAFLRDDNNWYVRLSNGTELCLSCNTLGGSDTQLLYNDNGVMAGDDGLTFDKTLNNLTLDKPGLSTAIGEGGIFFSNNNGTGTSRYHFGIDDYDIFRIKRNGDTTGDGDAWSLINLESPNSDNSAVDNESTLALTAVATATELKALDIYYDSYSRDNGAGMRLFAKTNGFDPLRFEQHDKTTSNGQWRFDDTYGTIGTNTVDVFSQATISGGVLAPQVDDWIWDNGNVYFPDDTKITGVAVNGGGYTLTLNKNLLATANGASFRGKNIHEYFRLTPDRQMLVRKFDPENATNVFEAGGDIFVDGDVDISGQYKVNGTPISTGVGSGDVTKVGTPSNGQLGVWTGDGTLGTLAELTATTTTLDTPKLVRINAVTGNPEFDLLENGTKRAAVYYNVAANQLVLQNNESNAIDNVWIPENTKISGQLNVDSNKIVNLTDGTNANDAVNKSQLDAVDSNHTVDTDTQLSQAQVGTFATAEGFIKTYTETDPTVNQSLIEGLGFVTGSHTVDTNTQLNESQVDAFVANNDFVTSTDVIQMVKITQAAYDLLSPPDANTFYIIID